MVKEFNFFGGVWVGEREKTRKKYLQRQNRKKEDIRRVKRNEQRNKERKK